MKLAFVRDGRTENESLWVFVSRALLRCGEADLPVVVVAGDRSSGIVCEPTFSGSWKGH